MVLSVAGGMAAAQPVPVDAPRRRLLQQAIEARDAGDHGGALDLFIQAGRIQMTPGLRMSLAQEYRAVGPQRMACDMATRCVSEMQDLSRPGSGEVLQGCAQIVTEVCTRYGRVTVRAPLPAPQGLQIRVQGREIEDLSTDVTVAVDPGPAVVVEAMAPGGLRFRYEFELLAGRTHTVTVTLRPVDSGVRPDLTRAPAGDDPFAASRTRLQTTPDGPHEGPSLPSSERVRVQDPMNRGPTEGPGVGPWLTAGTGLLSLGAAGVFYGVLRAGALRDRAVACPPATMICDPSAGDAQSRAESATLMTNVALGIGVLGVAVGALWYFLGQPPDATPRTAWRWGIEPIGGGTMVRVGGSL